MSNVTALTGATNLQVSLARTEQAVVIFPGDGDAVILDDQLDPDAINDLLSCPVQRIVTVARLRAWADLIERSGQ